MVTERLRTIKINRLMGSMIMNRISKQPYVFDFKWRSGIRVKMSLSSTIVSIHLKLIAKNQKFFMIHNFISGDFYKINSVAKVLR